jgi:hypothetical protein
MLCASAVESEAVDLAGLVQAGRMELEKVRDLIAIPEYTHALWRKWATTDPEWHELAAQSIAFRHAVSERFEELIALSSAENCENAA